MPAHISTRPADIRLDDRAIPASAITDSPATGAALETTLEETLRTDEINSGQRNLHVHVSDKGRADIAILVCRPDQRIPPTWWGTP